MRHSTVQFTTLLIVLAATAARGDDLLTDPSPRELHELIEVQALELRALRTRLDELEAISHGGRADPVWSGVEVEANSGPVVAEPGGGREGHDDLPTAGYDRGFFVRRPDDAFLLRVNSWFQLRYSAFDSDGPNADTNQFEFERARLVFRGYAYTKDLRYFLQLDGDSDRGENVTLLDYFARYDFGHDVLGAPSGRIGLRMGKWKLPFQRARAVSGKRLEFADRAVSSLFFDINRSVGLSLYGSNDLVEWEAALFNGFRTQGLSTGTTGQIDRNFGTSGRVTSVVLGTWDAEGEPDLVPNRCPALRLGAGFAHSRIDIEGSQEFARLRTNDTGATLASLLPPAVSEYSASLYTVDAHFKYAGLSVIFDYYFRHVVDFAGAPVPSLYDHGFLLQSGYMVVPEHLEVIGRWSRVVGDSSTLGVSTRSVDEVAGGLVWYLRGQNAKLVLDVTHVNGTPINDASVNLAAGDIGWLYRTQFQLAF